jgi:uncharacterized glyoxalase superfamily protein PhnB
MAAKPVPEGYHTITPYLTVHDARKVVDFLQHAFGAETTYQPVKRPDGKIMHVELKIGDSRVMLGEESETAKASSSSLYLYFANVDEMYRKAVAAGGASFMEPMDLFYGDRCAGVKDPSGNSWMIATHKEDLSPDEMKRRADSFYKQQKHKAA